MIYDDYKSAKEKAEQKNDNYIITTLPLSSIEKNLKQMEEIKLEIADKYDFIETEILTKQKQKKLK